MNQTPIEKAIEIAAQYGDIDGGHHKQWVIDQMLRALMTSEEYNQWVHEWETDGSEQDEYGDIYVSEWDTGIAP